MQALNAALNKRLGRLETFQAQPATPNETKLELLCWKADKPKELLRRFPDIPQYWRNVWKRRDHTYSVLKHSLRSEQSKAFASTEHSFKCLKSIHLKAQSDGLKHLRFSSYSIFIPIVQNGNILCGSAVYEEPVYPFPSTFISIEGCERFLV